MDVSIFCLIIALSFDLTNLGILFYSSASLEMHQKIGEGRIAVWRLIVFSYVFDRVR